MRRRRRFAFCPAIEQREIASRKKSQSLFNLSSMTRSALRRHCPLTRYAASEDASKTLSCAIEGPKPVKLVLNDTACIEEALSSDALCSVRGCKQNPQLRY